MYTRAIRHIGKWAIFLVAQAKAITPATIPQFSSLSRKTANEWADINRPMPPAYQLNSSIGRAVWRARG